MFMFHSYGAVCQRVSEGFLKWGILKYHGFQYSIFFPYCILKRHTLRQGKLNQYYNIIYVYILFWYGDTPFRKPPHGQICSVVREFCGFRTHPKEVTWCLTMNQCPHWKRYLWTWVQQKIALIVACCNYVRNCCLIGAPWLLVSDFRHF